MLQKVLTFYQPIWTSYIIIFTIQIKLFSVPIAKFLDISAKPFFLCNDATSDFADIVIIKQFVL